MNIKVYLENKLISKSIRDNTNRMKNSICLAKIVNNFGELLMVVFE